MKNISDCLSNLQTTTTQSKGYLTLRMKKFFDRFSNCQTRQSKQQEPRLGMFDVHSFPSPQVRKAWEVIRTSNGSDGTEVAQTYREAVTAVEEQARNIYKEDPFNVVPPREDFVQKMIEHGCFIVQVALISLGASENPNNEWSRDLVKGWFPSLFDMTWQLPLVVLKELTKQSFFVDVLKSRTWRRPKDMARMVLYDQLVEPMIQGPGHKVNFIKHFFNKSMNISNQEPPTLLHALWLHQTGPGAIIDGCINNDEDKDVESSSSWYTVRSVTELQQVGITFKSNEGKGSRGIEFKENMINAVLYLPSITIEPNTEKLFQHLIEYEDMIELGKTQHEVCSYLKLMGELIRTADDAKVLAMQGILNADRNGEADLPEMLSRLQPPDMVGDNQHMVNVRRKIRSYVKPSDWGKVINLILISLLLTLIQTIYAIVGYHHPPH